MQRFKAITVLFPLALTLLASANLASAAPLPRVCQRFDEDWRFAKGDLAGASAAAYDDSSWRRVGLPHDWSIEDLPPPMSKQDSTPAATPPARSGPFDARAEGGGAVGFTVGGVAWYRKTFVLPEAWRGRRVGLTFDGVYMNCQVWCNGRRVAEHPYGYTSFHVDLTAQASFGAANVLAVRVDASGRTSRWYPGAGIYRHVWLTSTDPLHVEPWGVFVTTPHVTPQEAIVHVRTMVHNDGDEKREVTLESRLLDPRGKTVASSSVQRIIEPAAALAVDQDLAAPRPALWSPDLPALYRVASNLATAGKGLDDVETTFGIRTIEVDAEKGLRINGRPVKLRGGCVHHDNGCLGACTLDRAEQRRVELLKAAGFNAIRTSHNPPSPAFLEACDRLGMFVMDEAFDCWLWGKNGQDYGRFFDAWWRRDVESMVLRDRNHPSVIFWSIGNEIPGQDRPQGAKYSKEISDYVRRLDPSRPVTQAFMPIGNWDDLFPAFAALDVCGYNYKEDRYRQDHAVRPRQVIVCTESMPRDCFRHWMSVLDLPYVIGDFVWTGYDYLGEAAIGRTRWDGETVGSETWPWTVAFCGDLDLCGYRRPQSYYREAAWGLRPTVACFVQQPGRPDKMWDGVSAWGWIDEQASWTWPGQEGKPLVVQAYSSCPHVRLTLNGRDLGMKDTDRRTHFTATWKVPYEPGQLTVFGEDARGHEQARWALRTAGQPAAVRLTPDRPKIHADGQDLCFVTVEVVDERGVVNPTAANLVKFSVAGPASVLAVSNGDPRSTESFQQPQRKAFRGRCQVVVKAGRQAGPIRLRAEAQGLKSGEIVIEARALVASEP